MKGKPPPNDLEHFESELKSAMREKNSPALLNRLPRNQPSFQQRGSSLEYLIGQQRLQSMPHRAAKSSAN
jgi:hypothetical protein